MIAGERPGGVHLPARPPLCTEDDRLRRQAVAFFLGDVSFLGDSRFRRLSRALPDPDEFLSAVGAYWTTVAVARGNGSRMIDAREETGSKYIDQLEAVGLLLREGIPQKPWDEWSGKAPQQVQAGRARAENALRDAQGRLISSSALDTAGPSLVPSVPSVIQRSPSLPSPPLPSNPLTNGEATKAVPSGDEDPSDVYWQLTGNFPSGRAKEWIGELAAEFGAMEAGNAIAAEFVSGRRDTLLKRAQNRLRSEADKKAKAAVAAEAQREKDRIAKSKITPKQAAEASELIAGWMGKVGTR